MAFKVLTLRKKIFGNFFGATGAASAHGHAMEYTLDILGILCAAAYIVGCYCFYSPIAEVYSVGDWCFIVASVINSGISVHTLVEQLHAMELEYPLRCSKRDELTETVLFLLANSCFAIGCIFFMPGLTGTAAGFLDVHAIGSWFCIVGSFGIVFAVFYNALGFHADECDHGIDEDVAHLCVNITRYSMYVLLLGGVLFVVGSFMYRPVFGGACPRGSTKASCLVVSWYGTTMFLWGSCCLLLNGVMVMTVGVMKHTAEDKDPERATLIKKRAASDDDGVMKHYASKTF